MPLYDTFYENLNMIHFIFNYSSLIQNYLKCLFYRVHIKNESLNTIEEKYIIIIRILFILKLSLIFRFIDFYKDQLDVYAYENIGVIYCEFDPISDSWITHNEKYKSFNVTIDSLDNKLNLYRIFPSFIGTKFFSLLN